MNRHLIALLFLLTLFSSCDMTRRTMGDDVYYSPSDPTEVIEAEEEEEEVEKYHSKSDDRDRNTVYNYHDYDDDYYYSYRLNRFNGIYNPYFYSYPSYPMYGSWWSVGFGSGYGWQGSYYSAFGYDPFYDPWYNPYANPYYMGYYQGYNSGWYAGQYNNSYYNQPVYRNYGHRSPLSGGRPAASPRPAGMYKIKAPVNSPGQTTPYRTRGSDANRTNPGEDQRSGRPSGTRRDEGTVNPGKRNDDLKRPNTNPGPVLRPGNPPSSPPSTPRGGGNGGSPVNRPRR